MGRIVGTFFRRRHHFRNENFDEVFDLVSALSFQEGGGYAHGDGQHWDQSEQGGVGKRGGAQRAAVADETFRHEHPKMKEPMKAGGFVVGMKAFIPQGHCVLFEFLKFGNFFRHANGRRLAVEEVRVEGRVWRETSFNREPR